ncbi:hypothetical protein C5167_009092 [Papaver somniferum]|uniref:Uncharacterized protein n=1 Tax=Papaver somniferum TaxID=3469 RepID=A0A4Y7K0C1_PAPSO|nr:hypothetical protein C5167_009092 [Papaver somniferum]
MDNQHFAWLQERQGESIETIASARESSSRWTMNVIKHQERRYGGTKAVSRKKLPVCLSQQESNWKQLTTGWKMKLRKSKPSTGIRAIWGTVGQGQDPMLEVVTMETGILIKRVDESMKELD